MWIFFFLVFVTHLHGQTTEFAWTHNGIFMDAQRNLLGQTTEFTSIHNFFTLCGQKNCIYIFTELAPLGGFSHRVAMSVCLSVCLFAPSDAFLF